MAARQGPVAMAAHQICIRVARCTKIINPNTEDAKYVINVKQIAKIIFYAVQAGSQFNEPPPPPSSSPPPLPPLPPMPHSCLQCHHQMLSWQKQSIQQIGALFLLIIAAVLLSIGEGSSKGTSSADAEQILFYGIIPVLVASVLSGLASSLCQWASQVKKHSSYLMTVEMSFVGSLCLLLSTSKSPDGEAIRQHGFFYGVCHRFCTSCHGYDAVHF
ncbi:hypothetical protein CMV_026161 [Castanea mollissima]|uniref:26S proteasome regulatory subunit 7-like OB domain-containing protein n=1 Tax=Castanea mollissima TaxID=60419 RepID=A0A8J4V469_9ROSI|nr:hypothetical protein CMV_026161 [Castanea mollissima]